jgi:uncharacterized cupin superfamily protein
VVPRARLETDESGTYPASEGWFVVNARDARWFASDGLGFFCPFEAEEARFAELGFNLNVLPPGEPGSMYHGEETQEDFLVLAGECLPIVEGQERLLGQLDFIHCPPWTEHVFVGAGHGPCLLLAVGARRKGRGIRYPVNEAALKHGAASRSRRRTPRRRMRASPMIGRHARRTSSTSSPGEACDSDVVDAT